MLFNSYIFIFAFLPVALAGYAAIVKMGGKGAALLWLTLCSMFFYGWWNPIYLPLLGISVVVNYALSYYLAARPHATWTRKAALVVGLTFNLGLLGYFKYANFFVGNLNALGLHWTLAKVILPLGISFFVFQKIAYLVDAYRGKITSLNFLDYSFFVSFFPQLIAGPIVHHSDILPQIRRDLIRLPEPANLSLGLAFFACGLFSKSVIADSIAPVANLGFAAAANGARLDLLEAWVSALTYTLQLYFDFAGYSYMAIGLGLLFNIKLPPNFNSPYKATSIIDFWRRWHMTLSAFLRDYLYIPLGGNRCGAVRNLFNLIATMLLGGLWHGANWTFLIWGGLHGIMLSLNHLWRSWRGQPVDDSRISVIFRTLVTFFFVVLGWVVFRSENLLTATRILASMFGMNKIAVPIAWKMSVPWLSNEYVRYRGFLPHLPVSGWFLAWLGFLLLWVLLAPNLLQIMYLYRREVGTENVVKTSASRWLTFRLDFQWAVTVGILSAIGICALSKTSEFLYFQF